jgi:hypothetical protein
LARRWRLSLALLALVGSLLSDAPVGATEKRKLPNYDGRGDPPVSAGDVLLWVPRVVLAPPYLVTEYVLRRPLGWAIAGAERAGLPAALYDFFAFGPDHKAGFAPTAFVDFGFRPSVGLLFFWNDALARGNDMRLQIGFWGTDWLAASFTDRIYYSCDPADVIQLEVSALRRPDYAFFGIGTEAAERRSRYGSDRLEARASVDKRFWRLSTIHAAMTGRQVDFRRGWFGDDPALEDRIAAGRPPPPGYTEGYALSRGDVSISIDSRLPRPAAGSGARVELRAAHSADFRGRGSWVSYGGSAGVFVDVNGRSRVLSLSGNAQLVQPIDKSQVPFTELAALGGFGPMRGFFPGRLLGQSAFVGELAYRWPIWIWLDGSMRVEMGNVFGAHLEGLELRNMRISAAIGVESAGLSDNPLEVLIGFGTERFAEGAKIDSFRLFVGSHRGF